MITNIWKSTQIAFLISLRSKQLAGSRPRVANHLHCREGILSMRSGPVSRHLTLNDAIEIWRRRLGGEAQHSIAAAYAVNQGRISEILSGKRFPAARRLAESSLRGVAQG